MLKRCDFRARRKEGCESISLMLTGRLFEMSGPQTEKARRPNWVLVRRTTVVDMHSWRRWGPLTLNVTRSSRYGGERSWRILCMIVATLKTRAHQQMRYPNVTWHIILHCYLFTTELRHTCTPEYFWSNAYISNGRRFTKSAFRVFLLSTLRVSRINYYLACSLPIHTRSSAIAKGARAHCQLKSCKILHKCSTDCTWKGLQPVNVLQGHSRSLPLLPFDRPYTISY